MEIACKLLSIVRKAERSAVASAARNKLSELRELTRKCKLGRIGEQRVINVLANGAGSHCLHTKLCSLLGSHTRGTAQNGADTRVSVLHVVDRIVLRLSLDLLDVKVDLLVARARDKRVTSGI